MIKDLTAQQIVNRIRAQCRGTWKESPNDVFTCGNPDTLITGIVTSFTPSIGVIRQAIAAGKNLLITQQPAYYGETPAYLHNDPAYNYKKELIVKHNLVLWRFDDNWKSWPAEGQLPGLAKMPPTPLKDIVTGIKTKLRIKGLRVIGDPNTIIHKAAFSHGMFRFAELQEFLKHPKVDLIVAAEAIEWESPEYFRDWLTWKGNNKAMILLGREASEDPGSGEVASWLRTFIPDIPIEWISAGEPFWVV